jgi:hypothetical protein
MNGRNTSGAFVTLRVRRGFFGAEGFRAVVVLAAGLAFGFGVALYLLSARNGGPFDPELLIPAMLDFL